MSNFLDFLSNNYVYFLIAAGVLLFALIGLLVDLKKKRDDGVVAEESILNVTPSEPSIPEPPVVEEKQEMPVQEEFNPAPPMPEEEVIIPNTENEVITQNEVVDNSAPVVNVDIPSEPVQEQIPQSNNTPEEFK